MGDMDGLKPGPRDHLITRALERLLRQLGAEFRVDGALDRAEAPERLARHAMAEIARQLAADGSDADLQAGRLNDLLRLPATPFGQSDLLVNAEGQPNIGSELRERAEGA